MHVERQLIPAPKARREILGISPATEWRWLQAGILPKPVKVRNRNYYDVAELNTAMAKMREAA